MKTLSRLVLTTIMALGMTGCMKNAIEGLGLGSLDEKKAPSLCSQATVNDYEKYKGADTDGTMKHNYEITFDCQMPEGV